MTTSAPAAAPFTSRNEFVSMDFERAYTSDAFVEIVLHLPYWQVSAIEQKAKRQGKTVGQLLRRMIAAMDEE